MVIEDLAQLENFNLILESYYLNGKNKGKDCF